MSKLKLNNGAVEVENNYSGDIMMSEDEEVVNKDNELYKHLLSLGYTEFETFDCKGNLPDQNSYISCLKSSDSKTHLNKPTPSPSNPIDLSVEAHQTIVTIIASKLLFVEDIELLESLVYNSSIQSCQSVNNVSMVGTLSLCLTSWALYYQIGTFFQLPLYLTGLCSLLCLWHCQKVYGAKKERKFLNSHIESLKVLCICIQKSYRFLKETEILSTGKVSTQNVNSAMYVKTTMNSEESQELSSWKLLPELRKSLLVALHDSIEILVLSCSLFSQLLPIWFQIQLRFNKNNSDLEKLRSLYESNFLNNSDGHTQISMRNLQSFIELYLDVQSEYLKILACCLFPQYLCQPYTMGFLYHYKLKDNSSRVKADVLKIINSTQSNIVQVYIRLKLQTDIHNKFGRLPVSFDSLPKTEYTNRVHHLQVQLHNIFLLLELMLLRIRSLEDVVEDLHDKGNNKKDKFPFSLAKELDSVRTDFKVAMKEFDHIYNSLIPLKPTEATLTSKTQWENKSCKKSKQISTGILLGMSDFSTNISDEFFLATAGSNTECEECSIDGYEIEQISKMPKTLISELSLALKSVRKEFRARERLALERIGLDGVENLPSDDEADYDKASLREKEECSHSNDEDNTDSTIELGVNTLHGNVENKLCLELGADLCSSDDQKQARVMGDRLPPTFTDTSSIANLVAMKSKMWGNQSEECFADE